MEDLVMTKAVFFRLIVLPFFGGWILAWLASGFLATTLRSGGRNHHAIAWLIITVLPGLSCFQWINFLVVNKLLLLEAIQPKEAQSFFVSALPSLLCYNYFLLRGLRKLKRGH